MFDPYTHLSTELRHLAFRKESEHATWQDTIKQLRVTDIEYRLGKLPNHFRVDMFNALLINLPSHHKAG
jgi:methyl coenzyme M reductase subunit C-like uncharacterized protein (methanogenesis marker protein 7)